MKSAPDEMRPLYDVWIKKCIDTLELRTKWPTEKVLRSGYWENSKLAFTWIPLLTDFPRLLVKYNDHEPHLHFTKKQHRSAKSYSRDAIAFIKSTDFFDFREATLLIMLFHQYPKAPNKNDT